MDLASQSRPAGVLLIASGVVHLFAPRLLLRLAAAGYDIVLATEFEPREPAPRRVRAVGVATLAVGTVLLVAGEEHTRF